MAAVHIKHHSMYMEKVSGWFENSRGPAQAPAERRGHKPCRGTGTAAAARHFLNDLHVLWKNITVGFQREIHCPLQLHKRMWVTH